MNDHSKHILCFISSEISMYLTKILELSANCMYSAVKIYTILSQWDATFYHSDIKALEYDKLVNHDFISGK